MDAIHADRAQRLAHSQLRDALKLIPADQRQSKMAEVLNELAQDEHRDRLLKAAAAMSPEELERRLQR